MCDDDGVGDDDDGVGNDDENGVGYDYDGNAKPDDTGRFIIKINSLFPVNSSRTMNLYAHNVHMYISE